MTKKIVFLDMDGVLFDFDGAIKTTYGFDPPEMFVPGFFRDLKVMPGSHFAVAELLSMPHLDVFVGSKPTSGNLNCATEKFESIALNFPRLLKKMVLACNKGLLRGDYLVDDDKERWEKKFQGTFIHFDKHNSEESWKNVVKILGEAK
jgi:5'(3')-deoxyribonucleotidase